jgi:predicted aspartyl protease
MMPAMRRSLTLALVIAVATWLVPSSLWAQIYRWVDGAGVPHYSEGLDSVPEAQRASAVPLGLRNKPAAADPRPSRRATADTTIRYAPGRPIVVDVVINGGTSARLIVDTGADRTMINPRTLTAAGVSLAATVGTSRVIGVTGTDQVSYVMVNTLDVAGVRVDRLAVGAYALPEAASDGLLGRDVLDRFNVMIDSAQGLVTLSPK